MDHKSCIIITIKFAQCCIASMITGSISNPRPRAKFRTIRHPPRQIYFLPICLSQKVFWPYLGTQHDVVIKVQKFVRDSRYSRTMNKMLLHVCAYCWLRGNTCTHIYTCFQAPMNMTFNSGTRKSW